MKSSAEHRKAYRTWSQRSSSFIRHARPDPATRTTSRMSSPASINPRENGYKSLSRSVNLDTTGWPSWTAQSNRAARFNSLLRLPAIRSVAPAMAGISTPSVGGQVRSCPRDYRASRSDGMLDRAGPRECPLRLQRIHSIKARLTVSACSSVEP